MLHIVDSDGRQRQMLNSTNYVQPTVLRMSRTFHSQKPLQKCLLQFDSEKIIDNIIFLLLRWCAILLIASFEKIVRINKQQEKVLDGIVCPMRHLLKCLAIYSNLYRYAISPAFQFMCICNKTKQIERARIAQIEVSTVTKQQ